MTYSDDADSRLTARHKVSLDILCQLQPSGLILNVGCGNGCLEYLENRLHLIKRARIISLDINIENLREARGSGATAVCARIDNLPFSKEVFSVVCAFEVLEHLSENHIKQFLSDVLCVSLTNVRLAISTPYADARSVIFDPAFWLVGHKHYSRRYLQNTLNQYGFVIQNCYVLGGIWEGFSVILLYLFKYLVRREIPFKSTFEKNKEREYSIGTNKITKGFMNIFITSIRKDASHI